MSTTPRQHLNNKPTYYNIGAYTVNLADPTDYNFLQAEVILSIKSAQDKHAFIERHPDLRALTIKYLSKHKKSELITEDGKIQLENEIGKAACNLIGKDQDCVTILLPSFIIQ